MKKMIFLVLTLLIWSAASMNAQVKIGGDPETEVTTGAVLELDGASGALLLPRVDALPTAENSSAGMQVYLTTNNKVYTYNGITWELATATNSVSSDQIVNGSILSEDLGKMNATTAGQPLLWNGATWDASYPGLLLPRVGLASTTQPLPFVRHQAGATVYNITISGSGTTAVTPGLYTNDGTKWVRIAAEESPTVVAGAPVITTQPTAFTFSRLEDVNGDPNSSVTSFSTVLTVVATGNGLSYQWYQKPKNTNGAGTAINGATNASYTVNIPASGLANWGMYSYYCAVSNTNGTVYSATAQVSLGCGAKTITGGWLSFMCHNLGADQSLDPFVRTNIGDTTSYDIKGWLFQWGRIADGHQWRSSPAVAGPYNGNVTADGQIPESATEFYGKFVTRPRGGSWRTPAAPNLWAERKTVNDPCPTGWRVPTSTEFASMFDGRVDAAEVAWQREWPTQRWWWGGGMCAMPDGKTVTLLLPTTGWRFHENALVQNGNSMIMYQAASLDSEAKYGAYLRATSAVYRTSSGNSEVMGAGIRCTAE